jgi:hypothetical membrane protein
MRARWTLVVGGALIAALGTGWFVLSHFVMHTTPGDALGESLGVVLALLVVASIAGALASPRNRPPGNPR